MSKIRNIKKMNIYAKRPIPLNIVNYVFSLRGKVCFHCRKTRLFVENPITFDYRIFAKTIPLTALFGY